MLQIACVHFFLYQVIFTQDFNRLILNLMRNAHAIFTVLLLLLYVLGSDAYVMLCHLCVTFVDSASILSANRTLSFFLANESHYKS